MDGTNTPASTEPAAEPNAAASTAETPPKTFTQDEVNRIAAKAREEGRKAALPRETPKSEPKGDDERLTLKELNAKIEDAETRRRFERQAAKRGVTDDEALDDLYDLYRAQKPTDEAAWFEKKAKAFVTAKEATPTPTAPEGTDPARKPAAATREPSRNGVLPTSEGLTDLFSLSDQQIAALGPAGVRAEFEKITAVATRNAGAPSPPHMRLNKR